MRQTVAFIDDIDATQHVPAPARHQQPAVAIDQLGKLDQVGAIAIVEIGLVRPAIARGIAAIGSLDHGMKLLQVRMRGGAYLDIRHAAPFRAVGRLWQGTRRPLDGAERAVIIRRG